jgi:hypothetical protein
MMSRVIGVGWNLGRNVADSSKHQHDYQRQLLHGLPLY